MPCISASSMKVGSRCLAYNGFRICSSVQVGLKCVMLSFSMIRSANGDWQKSILQVFDRNWEKKQHFTRFVLEKVKKRWLLVNCTPSAGSIINRLSKERNILTGLGLLSWAVSRRSPTAWIKTFERSWWSGCKTSRGLDGGHVIVSSAQFIDSLWNRCPQSWNFNP